MILIPILILAALLLAVLGISYWTYTVAFRSPNKTQGDIYNIPDNEQYGAAKILGTYSYVRVDSDDTAEEIHLERNGSVIANAINYQDLTVGSPQQVYVTFLKIQPGTSTLMFDLGDDFDGCVRLTWSNAYVSV